MNTLVGNMIPILLTHSFGVKYAGFYIVIQKFLGVPSNIIVNSIGSVFLQKSSTKKDCRKLYLLISLGLFIIVAPFLVVFYLYSIDLFKYFFG